MAVASGGTPGAGPAFRPCPQPGAAERRVKPDPCRSESRPRARLLGHSYVALALSAGASLAEAAALARHANARVTAEVYAGISRARPRDGSGETGSSRVRRRGADPELWMLVGEAASISTLEEMGLLRFEFFPQPGYVPGARPGARVPSVACRWRVWDVTRARVTDRGRRLPGRGNSGNARRSFPFGQAFGDPPESVQPCRLTGPGRTTANVRP